MLPNTTLQESVYVWETSYGLLEISGPDAKDLLHRLSTNDIMGIEKGQSTTTIFANPKGRIIDRVRISISLNWLDELVIYMYTSEGLAPTIAAWLESYTFMEDIAVQDLTEETVILEVIGSKAMLYYEQQPNQPSLPELTPNQVVLMEKPVFFAGKDTREVITRTDDPVAPTYLIHPPSQSPFVTYSDLLSNSEWITPSKREALRIHSAIPQSPNELNLKTNPLEVGLRGDINFEKGCYIGQEVILRLDTYKKVKRHLVKVSLDPGVPPDLGSEIVRSDDSVSCGKLTSLTEKIDGTGFEGLALVKSTVKDFNQDFEIHQTKLTWKVYLHPLPERE